MSANHTLTQSEVRHVVLDEIGLTLKVLGKQGPILTDDLCPMLHIPGLTSDLAEAITADILLRISGPEKARCPFTAKVGGRLQNLGECIREFCVQARAA